MTKHKRGPHPSEGGEAWDEMRKEIEAKMPGISQAEKRRLRHTIDGFNRRKQQEVRTTDESI